MRQPISHYLSEHFPELEHPMYQAAFERISFVFVTTALIGLFAAALALLASKL